MQLSGHVLISVGGLVYNHFIFGKVKQVIYVGSQVFLLMGDSLSSCADGGNPITISRRYLRQSVDNMKQQQGTRVHRHDFINIPTTCPHFPSIISPFLGANGSISKRFKCSRHMKHWNQTESWGYDAAV
mmetsp:Transcript_19259/g.39258  ORF Transcript_19259/g.39258 Transcript_19259/m.39258 type:complete len:129 (-) Transcript_19259:115-501(-)